MAEFRINYNVKGSERKRLVDAIASITGAEKKYLGAPTFRYTVDYFTIDKDGSVTFDDRADSEEIENLIEELAAQGFECEPQDGAESEEGEATEDTAEPSENAEQGETTALTVEIPFEHVNVGNLLKLLESKGDLIRKALGIDDIRIEMKEDRVGFPWFSEVKPEEAMSYAKFISMLCTFSKQAKRINTTQTQVENEKFAFRCFLLRLGFIGEEYKTDRKILLQRLSGSSAFKSGRRSDNVSA